jgi:hypothetical protein
MGRSGILSRGFGQVNASRICEAKGKNTESAVKPAPTSAWGQARRSTISEISGGTPSRTGAPTVPRPRLT